MRKNFIKLTTLLLMAFFASSAVAQNEAGDKEIGADFNFGIGASEFAPKTFFGAGIKGRWTLVDNFRLEASGTYMVVSETSTFYEDTDGEYSFSESYGLIDVCVNAHYLLGLSDGLFVYPIAGVGFAGVAQSGTEGNASAFVLNIGAGGQYMFSENWGANLEAKYKLLTGDSFNYINLSLGVVYKF